MAGSETDLKYFELESRMAQKTNYGSKSAIVVWLPEDLVHSAAMFANIGATETVSTHPL